MGLLARSVGFQALSMEDPAQPLLPPGALFDSLGLGRSDAGVLVNEAQAMRIGTVQTCIRIISEDLASNSHEILQNMPDRSIQPAYSHRLWPILHDQPNPNMTAKVFWGALLASALASGNGYAWIKRDGAARVIALVPLKSSQTAPVMRAGEFLYGTTQTHNGAVAYIDPVNILHIKGVSFDGILGLNPIQTCMNMFGLAIAAEKFGAQFFGNGARASGIFTYPGQLEEEAGDNLKKSVREWATGENALRPVILEEGMTWTQNTIAPNEAQFLQTRQYQRSEIAGLYRVPMHLIGDLQRATNNNIEHQSLDYVRYCLRPWAVAIEQEVNTKLLAWPFMLEHNFLDMQRGDFGSQVTALQMLRNNGIYSANDCLRFMRQNPISAEDGGDIRIVQGAMIPLTSLLPGGAADGTEGATDPTEGATQPFDRIAPAYRNLFRDAVGRSVRRPRDREFVVRTMKPLASSMMQVMLAMRFGNCELTKNELGVISAHVESVAAQAPSWQKDDIAAIATRLVEQTFAVFGQEVLGAQRLASIIATHSSMS